MNRPVRLMLGTNNQGKIREMIALLDDLPLDLVTPISLDCKLDVKEVGKSYLENAAHKALTWAKQCDIATLADDSGLEVDALDGSPGIYSHRFTGNPDASDYERRRFLVNQLQIFPRPWFAHFVCVVAIAIPGQDLLSTSGYCYGQIIPDERGTNGFGYDPIFFVSDAGKTMAELSTQEKNIYSHRAKALKSARPILIDRLLKGKSTVHQYAIE
jgi:XTP/dITP diphosphohydrolase